MNEWKHAVGGTMMVVGALLVAYDAIRMKPMGSKKIVIGVALFGLGFGTFFG
jgi:hypothetical protein